MASLTLTDLPNEILQQILFYATPNNVSSLQRVSRRFNDLAQPLLWRYHCRSQFMYWSSEHQIMEKYLEDVVKVDWKGIFMERHSTDRATTHAIDSILSSQTGRIDKFQRIVESGYDAKDTLLRHMSVGDEAEDVLARRYYSDAALGYLHRTLAIKEWASIKNRQDVSLERALAAYDMFVLHGREGDFDDISSRLDHLADQIRASFPQLQQQTPRQKAVTIVGYLRENNLTGIKGDDHYNDLQNNFIGIALHDEDHPSLPLISVAIYCCVARRLGLDAHPCGFPFHVLAIVKAANGVTLDGRPLEEIVDVDPMYLDPFRSDGEIPIENLRAQLVAMGATQSSHAALMGVSHTAEMVLRTGRNIINSVQTVHRNAIERNGHGGPDHLTILSTFPEMDSAFYSALWTSLLLGIPPDGDGPVAATVRRRQYLPYIVEHFETHFPTDVSLIEEYIVPLFQNLGEYAQLQDTVRVMRASDSMPKQVKRRTEDISEKVQYRIGQVFKHKRYGYQAVITGWDVECGAGEQWMAQMRVHELARGRHQSFYHVLVEDKSVRYVAEENIEITTPETPYLLMAQAGRHFKRWDKEKRRFISNIKDEYPDD